VGDGRRKVSRRQVLGGLGAAGVGSVLLGSGRGVALERLQASTDGAVPFYGVHQAGITTPVQDRLLFGAFDVSTSDRRELIDLLRTWTAASARMTNGETVGDNRAERVAPPADTGEAVGLQTSRLTITFGFGPTLFTLDGNDRFGIASRRPSQLADIPAFPLDALESARSGGDIGVQVCGDDPQVVFHALRNLTRMAKGIAGLRWSQLGFGRTSTTSEAQETPRNLQGFKDGTNNIRNDDDALLASQVWVQPGDDPTWMRGGSYLVARRIRMLIEVWDRSSLDDQEQTIGRVKSTGAPLGGHRERQHVDLHARAHGEHVIADDAHIRLAAPASNHGAHLLRRGYSFTDGVDPSTAQLDAGLFFLAYQRDPRKQFVPIQQRLAELDALNEYIKHTGSAVFAVPPGARRGGWVGETLFA
jgi:deferrochelatase/peroxidase EfeB